MAEELDLEGCWAELLPNKRQPLGPIELPAERSTVWGEARFLGRAVLDRIETDVPHAVNKTLNFVFDFRPEKDVQVDEFMLYLTREGGPPLGRCSFNAEGRGPVRCSAGDNFTLTYQMPATEPLMLLLSRAIRIIDF